MSLGLPGHLARDSLSRALAHAGHCAAWVCLGIAVTSLFVFDSSSRRRRGYSGSRPGRGGIRPGSLTADRIADA